jgi:hypothetical protein
MKSPAGGPTSLAKQIARISTAPLALLLFATAGVAGPGFDDTFTTTPFDAAAPRWCERYHHGHYVGGAVRFSRSSASGPECRAGGEGTSLSCREEGCDPCACCAGSPCSKVGDPQGNAVIQTAGDHLGVRRSVTAKFQIERQLPVGGAHIGIYVALHPHCHTTVEGLLVPDRPGVYHLNLAASNQYIGGAPGKYRECRENSFAAISQPLASEIALGAGEVYTWRLDARLDAESYVVASSVVQGASGATLASGEYRFTDARADSWFGRAGKGARYAFGAQLAQAASPSGGEPSLLLLEFHATEPTVPGKP